MAIKDNLKPTGRKGVFYQEHETRKNGVKKDRLWVLRYTIKVKEGDEVKSRTKTGAFGWASTGLTELDAEKKIAEFRANAKKGTGSTSLAEEQKQNKDAEERQRQEESYHNTTLGQFFDEIYLPQCQIDKKPHTARTEEIFFNHWIRPVLGNLHFNQIGINHLDKIKSNMKAGKRAVAKKNPRDRKEAAKNAQQKRTPAKPMAPRSINYVLAIIRQIWNRACASNPPLAFGEWPGANKAFKKPKVDNQRKRFLTRNEAAILFAALKVKSQDLHDMALLALHCGLRAGEIFSLTWDKVNLPKGELLLVDTKNGESRISYLTDETLAMLRQRSMNCQHKRLVFVSVVGKDRELRPYNHVPVTFPRTVKELGLNEGVTDTRDKIVFHSLRHTYASWLVENGASLPIVRDLMGHKNLIMTSRYSHVSAEAQKDAVKALNQSMRPTGENVVQLHKNKQE